VDPDPVGSETFSWVRKKSFLILAAPDPKNFSGKVIKFDNFSTKMLFLKILIPFYQEE
jgi:hypothetical protein